VEKMVAMAEMMETRLVGVIRETRFDRSITL
jgi:hypothetical protein